MNRILLRFFIFFVLIAFLNGIQIQAANRHGGEEYSDTARAESSSSSSKHSVIEERRAKKKERESSQLQNSVQTNTSSDKSSLSQGSDDGAMKFNVQQVILKSEQQKSEPTPSGRVSHDEDDVPPPPPMPSQVRNISSTSRPSSTSSRASSSGANGNSAMQQAVAKYNKGSSSNIVKYDYKINNIPIKSPAITQSMRPGVNCYSQGNYVGAVQSLKEVVKKEPKNDYAKYYLALAYTKLGYQDLAAQQYQAIIDSGNNYALSLYSQRALDCTGKPGNTACIAPKKESIQTLKAQNDAQIAKQLREVQQQRQEQIKEYNANLKKYNEDLAQYNKNKEQFYADQRAKDAQAASDIQKFIESGQKVHPAAMDRITREKMERQIQEAQKKALEAGK